MVKLVLLDGNNDPIYLDDTMLNDEIAISEIYGDRFILINDQYNISIIIANASGILISIHMEFVGVATLVYMKNLITDESDDHNSILQYVHDNSEFIADYLFGIIEHNPTNMTKFNDIMFAVINSIASSNEELPYNI